MLPRMVRSPVLGRADLTCWRRFAGTVVRLLSLINLSIFQACESYPYTNLQLRCRFDGANARGVDDERACDQYECLRMHPWFAPGRPVGANVRAFVLEFLLGKYCASSDEVAIQMGLRVVNDTLANNYIRPDEAAKAQSKSQGERKILLHRQGESSSDRFRLLGGRRQFQQQISAYTYPVCA